MKEKEKQLTNLEFEAMFSLWLIGVFMIIRGLSLVLTSNESVNNSELYTAMDNIIPFQIWGVIFITGAIVVIGSSVSQTIKKYYGLIAGNALGVIVGFPFSFIAFSESHMAITQYTITLIAFFNAVLVIHGGVCIWREKRKIRTLRKLN